MARNNETETPAINIIRKGTEIKGDVVCAGDIRIDGTLIGTITSEGKVVVGNTGLVDGEITCKHADVSGTIKAKITIKELLQLKSTANILGDINANKLSIEPGATFTGSCNMGTVVSNMKNEEKHSKQVFEEVQTA